MRPIHPGRILKREMTARRLSANRLALDLRLPSGRITDIVNGKRGISADTALRLGRYFGNSARFWANLQTAYDLARAEQEVGAKVKAEVQTAA
jgi:addiction module HigA family antidote